MTIIYHPKLSTELEKYGIAIPLCDDRSQRVFERLKQDFPHLKELDLSLLEELTRDDLKRAHDSDFLERWFSDEEFITQILYAYDCQDPSRYLPERAQAPLTQLRESILSQVKGTVLTVKTALEAKKFCYYLGGGMHHARSYTGAGFCPLSDIVIALRKAQKEYSLQNILILDVDAHMGDGTAEITKDDPTLTTISLHMADGWPIHSELPIISSDYDLPFKLNEEESYLPRLQNILFDNDIMDKKWDLLFVVNGADPYEGDALKSSEGLKLSKEQLLARDMLIYKWARDLDIPQAWVMAGGYGEKAADIYSQFLLKILHLMG